MLFCYKVHACVLVSFDFFCSFRVVPNIGHWKANTKTGLILVPQYLLLLTYCNSFRAVPNLGHWRANTGIGSISVLHYLYNKVNLQINKLNIKSNGKVILLSH